MIPALLAATMLTAAAPAAPGLADDPQWRRLVHYVSDTRSDVLPGDFFVAPDGRTDPQAELDATITALTAPVTDDPNDHAQCRFPARYAFLAARVPAVRDAAPTPCPALNAWRDEVGATGASVVFASGHLSNPASFYGHLMLRLDRDEAARDGAGDLFEATLNYGAIYPEDENGLVYVVRGLTGAYPSGFSQLGFYTHRQRYTEEEQRDVWTYELDLSPDELRRLTDHAWELADTNNRYYFAKQNCAWRIAELIGVAVARDLNQAPKQWAMPSDVLAELTGRYGEPLVRGIGYVPSREARTKAALAALSPSGADAAKALVEGDEDAQTVLSALAPTERAGTLDLAIDRLRLGGGMAARKRELMIARLGLPPGGAAPAPDPGAAPHTGQRSSLLRLYARHNDARGSGAAVRFRAAYYDLLTANPATAPGSELTLVDVEADVLDGEADLRRVELMRITALNANRTGFAADDKAAWQVRAGAEAATLSCRGCLQAYAEGGWGKAWQAGESLTLFGLATGRAAWPPRDLGHVRLGGRGGVLIGEDRPVRALIEGGGSVDVDAGGDTVWFARAATRFGTDERSDLGISVTAEDRPDGSAVEVDASLSIYF